MNIPQWNASTGDNDDDDEFYRSMYYL